MSKQGEIYEIPYKSVKRYFQLVASDKTVRNSDVIAVFNFRAEVNDKPLINDILNSGVEFFMHTTVDAGVTESLWYKIGKAEVVDYSKALFKDIYHENAEPKVEPYEVDSYPYWVVWHANGERTQIGADVDIYPEAELGLVHSPDEVVYRIEVGKYSDLPYYGQER